MKSALRMAAVPPNVTPQRTTSVADVSPSGARRFSEAARIFRPLK